MRRNLNSIRYITLSLLPQSTIFSTTFSLPTPYQTDATSSAEREIQSSLPIRTKHI